MTLATHDDGIKYLRSQGIPASRRRWSLGDCVGVPAFPLAGEDGISAFEFIAWLVPHGAGAWDVVHLVRMHERRLHLDSLDGACRAALDVVSAQRPRDQCPACGGERELEVREKNRWEHLSWSVEARCTKCGRQEKSDGDGPLPSGVRQLEVAQNGTWLVGVRQSVTVDVLNAVRAHLPFDIGPAAQIRLGLPAALYEGTFGEAYALSRCIEAHGGESKLTAVGGCEERASHTAAPELDRG